MGGVWKGRRKVGCLGEKELHVCTEYIEMYSSTVYIFFLHEYFFLYMYVLDVYIIFQ